AAFGHTLPGGGWDHGARRTAPVPHDRGAAATDLGLGHGPELGLRGVGMVAGGHFGASCPRSGSLCRWLITTGAADQMARRGQQDPTDWVSRAADDALRHADDTG